ncbi:hypothetical protein ACTXNJ_19960, partial [Pseudomonas helleri]
SHTHDSCIKEVPSCDVLILILGQRFGGTATESALEGFDFEALTKASGKPSILEDKDKLSITQLEVLKAVENSIPIYAYVDEKVYHDHLVYEKNKHDEEIIARINFPSIQKRETARYIFEFINFLSHRVQNNSIIPYGRLEDIKSNLISQWSQLFQRLLSENRVRTIEAKRYRDFSERIDDLKAVVLATISGPNMREIAKGAVQFRHLVTFVSCLKFVDHRSLLLSEHSWDDLLAEARIVEVRVEEIEGRTFQRNTAYLVLDDNTFYRSQITVRYIENIKSDWQLFLRQSVDTRTAITDALLGDSEDGRRPPIMYFNENIDVFLDRRKESSSLGVAINFD